MFYLSKTSQHGDPVALMTERLNLVGKIQQEGRFGASGVRARTSTVRRAMPGARESGRSRLGSFFTARDFVRTLAQAQLEIEMRTR